MRKIFGRTLTLAELLALLSLTLASIVRSKTPALSAGTVYCAERLSSCSCRLTNGQIIDLSPLQSTPGPAFNYEAPDGYTYQFNPCLAFQCGPDRPDAAVCQEKLIIIYTYKEFGSQTSAQFGSNPSTGQLYIRYVSSDMSQTTTVNLLCDPDSTDSTVTTRGAVGTQLTLDLKSRHACPTTNGNSSAGGISVGDVLLIVFFCLVIIYLVAGVLINKFVRQQSGPDLVPNLHFWTSLPGLAVDGALFTFSEIKRLTCCRSGARESYDSFK